MAVRAGAFALIAVWTALCFWQGEAGNASHARPHAHSISHLSGELQMQHSPAAVFSDREHNDDGLLCKASDRLHRKRFADGQVCLPGRETELTTGAVYQWSETKNN